MKNHAVYLDDILESIKLIKKYVKGMTLKKFDANQQTQDSVARRIGIIGEAAKHLPASVRAQRPDVPWKKVIGMRNVIIHDYAGTSAEHVWATITNDLEPLAKAVRMLKKMNR